MDRQGALPFGRLDGRAWTQGDRSAREITQSRVIDIAPGTAPHRLVSAEGNERTPKEEAGMLERQRGPGHVE